MQSDTSLTSDDDSIEDPTYDEPPTTSHAVFPQEKVAR